MPRGRITGSDGRTTEFRSQLLPRYARIFLDGFHLKIRIARRVVSVPVLAALGVAENGQKCLLDLRIAASEAEATWGGVIILYGLVAFGQIQLRKIDGPQQRPSFIAKEWKKVG